MASPLSHSPSSVHLFFFRNWWVIVFIVMTCALYFQDLHNKRECISHLVEKIDRLEREKKEGLEERERLVVRKESQEDPDSIELILKERLGVVSEGEVKVLFQEK